MAAELGERIMAVVEAKLASSGPSFGYTPELAVNRPPSADQEIPASGCPAISIRLPERTPRVHLRDAEELILTVTLICTETTPDKRTELMLYAKAVILANVRWNDGTADLARRTWTIDEALHETEVGEKTVSGSLTFRILARADRADLTQVKAI